MYKNNHVLELACSCPLVSILAHTRHSFVSATVSMLSRLHVLICATYNCHNSVQRLSLSLEGVTSQGSAPRLPLEIPIEVADDATDA
jgi:hypothetical protein